MTPRGCLRNGSVVFLLIAATSSVAISDDWPQWRGTLRDGVWRESGIVDELPPTLTPRWRTEIGEGYAGPAVAAGRVYVADRILKPGAQNPENPFDKSKVDGHERVLCLDAQTGAIQWTHEYLCPYTISYAFGPRATPTVDGDRVYTVGAMGDLLCLNASDGKVRWSKRYVQDFGTKINTWGMAAAPLVDGDRLILLVGGKDAAVVCLDKHSGKKLWQSQHVEDPGYAPPMIVTASGRRQLIIWTPEAVCGLAVDDGELYWKHDFALRSGLSVTTPIFDSKENRLFVTSFYDGPLMLGLQEKDERPSATPLWKGKSESERETDGLHAIMCTPYFDDGHIYGVCSYGQLRCLDATTGKRLWETIEATGKGRWWNAFLVRHEDKTIICNEQGELIFAKLRPGGYEEISRGQLIEPTRPVQRRKTVWSHPAFANRSVYARNDKEILCVDLSRRNS